MRGSALVRWSGLAAMSGGALGVVLTPILVYLWTTYSDAYLTYGKAYFLVYLGCLAGLVGLNAQRKGRSRAEKRGISILFAGLTLAFVGDIVAYWGDILGGEPSAGGEFTSIQAGGFAIEMWGFLLLLVGSVILGITYLRENARSRVSAWLLILAGPGGILLSALHAPSGTMLVFCFAWAAVGYTLWSLKSEAIPRIAPAK